MQNIYRFSKYGQPPEETTSLDRGGYRDLRLFLEELCFNLCIFEHVQKSHLKPEQVQVSQEVLIGPEDSFADLKVSVPDSAPYFVEIKYGYPRSKLIKSIIRKYSKLEAKYDDVSKLVLVVDTERFKDWSVIQKDIENGIDQKLTLDVWDEKILLNRIRETFNISINSLHEEDFLAMREAVDEAKGSHAFGELWKNSQLQCSLLWHFGFWRLRQLREIYDLAPENILSPHFYKQVVILIADISSFSSYVRDTRNNEVVRQCLTSFYSKVRYEIISRGGMMYQMLGDEVIGLFGIPIGNNNYQRDALDCAWALTDIGKSICNKWQRQIDRVQESSGVHIGMAMGNVQLVTLRPYGYAHLGAVSDSINMAARLLSHANTGEIVASNTFYHSLPEDSQAEFSENLEIKAKNVGKLIAWRANQANKNS